jgi:trimethylamine-N-oxide reductase (cytochrome c)
MSRKAISKSIDKTCIKGMGFSSFGNNSTVAAVDVKDNKLVRIRPLHYDWKYDQNEFNPWKIKARGKVFEPPMKTLITPFGAAYKKRIYSPNRILYPLKRVDWDPDGERHPERRGKSGYVRISWDEATDIIVSEIKRVIKKYGADVILAQCDGHGETKVVHAPHGCNFRLLNLLGGCTLQIRNPDSWEGWYWGAKHVWGMEAIGTMSPYHTNIYTDISRNTEMILFQGGDPETTPWGFGGGQMTSRLCFWFTELGIKQVYICPDVNYGAAVHADKWIPIRPNTDAAMHLAIAYQWITQDTYNKEYVSKHVFGFDQFKDYVLGTEDGIAKTPTWAAEITGVPSRIIKALAKEWSSKKTTVGHGFGGPMIRGSYSHEPARLEVCLLGMQGLGSPGIHQLCMIDMTFLAWIYNNFSPVPPPTPGGIVRPFVGRAYRGYEPFMPMPRQIIPKTMVHDAILKGQFTIYGSSLQSLPVEDQFKKYVYPAEGCSPIHMIWTDTPCLMTCWNDSNRNAEAYQHDSIEFFLAQHPWMENDCLFADIILPINTKFEEEDIGDDSISCHFDSIFLEEKCIESYGESKSDYEAVCVIAEKLGLLNEYTEGKSVEEWMKYGYTTSGVQDMVSWESLKEKGYYVVPTDPNWETYKAGMIDFYKDPEKHPLNTPSGKLTTHKIWTTLDPLWRISPGKPTS